MNISTPDVLGRQANCVVRNVGCLKRNQTIARDAYAKFQIKMFNQVQTEHPFKCKVQTGGRANNNVNNVF